MISKTVAAFRRAGLAERHIDQVGLIGGEYEHALQPLDRFEKLIGLPQRQPEAAGRLLHLSQLTERRK